MNSTEVSSDGCTFGPSSDGSACSSTDGPTQAPESDNPPGFPTVFLDAAPSKHTSAAKRDRACGSSSRETETKGLTDGKRTKVWPYCKEIGINGQKRAQCDYCDGDVGCGLKEGTSAMLNHLRTCKKYPPNIDKAQKQLAFRAVRGDEGDSRGIRLGNWKFKQEDARLALAKMIIIDEMPFKSVEREGFQLFMSIAQPHFMIPSRWTVARDVFRLYSEERRNLMSFLSKCNSRISLTIDTWNSCQNLDYMCLTAHFIDQNWNLHKKILNFCPIVSQSGEAICHAIESCLLEWGITTKVMTITFDNASANDTWVEQLRKRLKRWNGDILNGKFLHVRCVAHDLNLIVKEGLKESDESIRRVRHAVRFVRSSPARLKKFNTCVVKEQISAKHSLCLDVETRWNTTYIMLDSALVYRKAFEELESSDGGKFRQELEKSFGVPDDIDWERVGAILPFLKVFYEATIRLSGSLYTTTNAYIQELVGIDMMIKLKCNSLDYRVSEMAHKMKTKQNKYYADVNNLNLLLYVALVLDPTRKMRYTKWAVKKQYSAEKSERLIEMIMDALLELFNHYSSLIPQNVSSPPLFGLTTKDGDDVEDWRELADNAYEMDVCDLDDTNKKSELDKYLADEMARNTSKQFDILGWWKLREDTYPILCLMARDVLAIPISSVASESAFSTGGRILDPFRSSLAPNMVQALVCCQDWIKRSRRPLLLEENIEEVEKISQELMGDPAFKGSEDYI